MKTMIALLKREILEHKNIWFIPIVLVGIAVLARMSMVFGNLSFDFELPPQLQLDDEVSGVINGFVARALNYVNYIIMMTMFIVACFYTLSCLYDERQDESVLFWRSLPISDSMTIASKLIIALVVIPLMVVLCQTVVAIVFFGTGAIDYLSIYFAGSLSVLMQILLWSLVPTVAWCLFCSEVAKKTPFLLAFIAPILLWIVDALFLKGAIGDFVQVNRWIGYRDYSTVPLLVGLALSAVFITLATIKRSQRI